MSLSEKDKLKLEEIAENYTKASKKTFCPILKKKIENLISQKEHPRRIEKLEEEYNNKCK